MGDEAWVGATQAKGESTEQGTANSTTVPSIVDFCRLKMCATRKRKQNAMKSEWSSVTEKQGTGTALADPGRPLGPGNTLAPKISSK